MHYCSIVTCHQLLYNALRIKFHNGIKERKWRSPTCDPWKSRTCQILWKSKGDKPMTWMWFVLSHPSLSFLYLPQTHQSLYQSLASIDYTCITNVNPLNSIWNPFKSQIAIIISSRCPHCSIIGDLRKLATSHHICNLLRVQGTRGAG